MEIVAHLRDRSAMIERLPGVKQTLTQLTAMADGVNGFFLLSEGGV